MGTKIELPLEQDDWMGDWNARALKAWALGDVCHLSDGSHEMYGPYSLDAVKLAKIVLDCPGEAPPLPNPRVWSVAQRGKNHLILAGEGVRK